MQKVGKIPMHSITRFVLAHRGLVVLAWLAAAVAGAVTAGTTTSRLTASVSLPGQPGDQAANAIAATYGNGGAQVPAVVVITLPAGTTVTSPGVTDQLRAAFEGARVSPQFRVVDYATTGDPAFLTTDRHSALALVFAPPTGLTAADPAARVPAAVQAAAPPAWQVRVTGLTQLAAAGGGGNGSSLLIETLLGVVGALVVLVYVFASFLAVLPLIMAGVSILTTLLLVLGLTAVTDVSVIVQFLVALIGLGVAIDYSLLVVTRWREERAHGQDNRAAVQAAMLTAGRSVVFSGLTVAIGLLALVVLPVPFLRSVGYGGVLIPVVSVGVATTLLPAVLATVGPRLDHPRLRHESAASRPWAAWARLVIRRRWIFVIIGAVLLSALMIPAFSLHPGEPQSAAPLSPARPLKPCTPSRPAVSRAGFSARWRSSPVVVIPPRSPPGCAPWTVSPPRSPRPARTTGAVTPP